MPTIDDVGKAATLVRADAVAFLCVFFFFTTVASVVQLFRVQRRKEVEVAELNADRLEAEEHHTAQLVAILSAGKRTVPPRPRRSRKSLPALEAPDGQEGEGGS